MRLELSLSSFDTVIHNVRYKFGRQWLDVGLALNLPSQ